MCIRDSYVGGDFTVSGANATANLAAFDTTTGNNTSWTPDPDNEVHVLALDGSTLYVGGEFANIGGAGLSTLAAISVSTGLATAWVPPTPNAAVKAMKISGNRLLVGGEFVTLGATPRNGAASFSLTTGLLEAWNPDLGAAPVVVNFGLVTGGIYIGGQSFWNTIGPEGSFTLVDSTTGAPL